MKTKTCLFLCLILGIGLTQLSGQIPLPANGKTGVVPWSFTWNGYYIDIPVARGQQAVDRCVGYASAHGFYFYKDGVIVAEQFSFHGEVTNPRTGEVFEVKDFYVCKYSDKGGYGNWYLKGNKGSQYSIIYFYDWASDSFRFLSVFGM
jgi:hypothetical protein